MTPIAQKMTLEKLSMFYFSNFNDDNEKLYFCTNLIFDKYLLSTYYVPGTILGTGEIPVNKTDKKSLQSSGWGDRYST